MNLANFMVIEGLDGSGKTTQLNLLRNHLEAQGTPYHHIHFPMLNQGQYGTLVAEYLRGEFGAIEAVHPKLVALLFANDRKEHVHQLQQWLAAGHVVIADRYVNSNIAFQCAKCPDPAQKQALKQWILDFEYGYNALPRPATSLYLDVPFEAVKKSLTNQRTGQDRNYLGGKADIHETDLSFQEKVRQQYLAMVQEQADFKRVECFDAAGNFLPPQQIHQAIKTALNL